MQVQINFHSKCALPLPARDPKSYFYQQEDSKLKLGDSKSPGPPLDHLILPSIIIKKKKNRFNNIISYLIKI